MNYTDYAFIRSMKKLIAINNQRYRKYSLAMEKTNDQHLRLLFQQTKHQIMKFNLDLIKYVVQFDEDPLSESTGLSKTHKMWLNWMARLSGNRNALLQSCIQFDSLALKAYHKISMHLQYLPAELKKIIIHQKLVLESSQIRRILHRKPSSLSQRA